MIKDIKTKFNKLLLLQDIYYKYDQVMGIIEATSQSERGKYSQFFYLTVLFSYSNASSRVVNFSGMSLWIVTVIQTLVTFDSSVLIECSLKAELIAVVSMWISAWQELRYSIVLPELVPGALFTVALMRGGFTVGAISARQSGLLLRAAICHSGQEFCFHRNISVKKQCITADWFVEEGPKTLKVYAGHSQIDSFIQNISFL